MLSSAKHFCGTRPFMQNLMDVTADNNFSDFQIDISFDSSQQINQFEQKNYCFEQKTKNDLNKDQQRLQTCNPKQSQKKTKLELYRNKLNKDTLKLQSLQSEGKYERIDEQKRKALLQTFIMHPEATISSISQAINLSRTKVSQTKKEFELTGDIRVTSNGNTKSLLRVQSQRRQNKAIIKIIKHNPKIILRELALRLDQQYGIKLRRSCLHKRLTQLGYSFMPITSSVMTPTSNDEETILQRAQFCKIIKYYKLEDLYACGISKFSTNSKHSYAWLPKSSSQKDLQKIYEKTFVKECTVHIIVTIHASTLVNYDFFVGDLTKDLFAHHLRKGVFQRQAQLNEESLLMISDQICRYFLNNSQKKQVKEESNQKMENDNHLGSKILCDSQRIQQVFKHPRMKFVVFPQFSPQLNPLYFFFRTLKTKFKAFKILKRRVATQEQIKAGLKEAINFIPNKNYSDYFKKIENYLKIQSPQASYFIEQQE